MRVNTNFCFIYTICNYKFVFNKLDHFLFNRRSGRFSLLSKKGCGTSGIDSVGSVGEQGGGSWEAEDEQCHHKGSGIQQQHVVRGKRL